MPKTIVKSLLLNVLWCTLGRRNLVRLARFLNNESRLDVNNDPATNGETIVQSTILEYLKQNEKICIFDIGANIGSWTYSLFEHADKTSSLIVHAFEPCTDTYSTLTTNLHSWNLNGNIKSNNLALSSSVSKLPFYSLGPNIGTNSLSTPADPTKYAVESVQTETIDGYCLRNNISHIDLIKIDTEGHDMEVIYGGNNMLASGAIDILQFEYNHRWIDGRHFLRDAFELLLPLGFIIGKITPKGIEFYPDWDYELETFVESNYLAVKQSLRNIFPQIRWWKKS
ncbi:MAG: FkbM family methyltransferase [Bacteroidetes bacterium]|nr:FkbM family methyltransferase [Bacteroidota bacterium]